MRSQHPLLIWIMLIALGQMAVIGGLVAYRELPNDASTMEAVTRVALHVVLWPLFFWSALALLAGIMLGIEYYLTLLRPGNSVRIIDGEFENRTGIVLKRHNRKYSGPVDIVLEGNQEPVTVQAYQCEKQGWCSKLI
ncbi:hypothetical protein CA54_01130 [Symmachiella macrocystis]|uniref:KOW domain-containing protein n=1 Tax=Symmachiella macrocystis TaxID=2527985 RepID=A0A5C6BHX9_9PLAN|nr:KOW motif-containing protein [Symmachiella macrocystis]TWU11307.1 hypothetical protein CA54_01130 [Symmachiella macrocystis]